MLRCTVVLGKIVWLSESSLQLQKGVTIFVCGTKFEGVV